MWILLVLWVLLVSLILLVFWLLLVFWSKLHLFFEGLWNRCRPRASKTARGRKTVWRTKLSLSVFTVPAWERATTCTWWSSYPICPHQVRRSPSPWFLMYLKPPKAKSNEILNTPYQCATTKPQVRCFTLIWGVEPTYLQRLQSLSPFVGTNPER